MRGRGKHHETAFNDRGGPAGLGFDGGARGDRGQEQHDGRSRAAAAPSTDANGNPKPPSDIDVNPNPNPAPAPENKAVSPSPAGAGDDRAAATAAGERQRRRQSDATGAAVGAAHEPASGRRRGSSTRTRRRSAAPSRLPSFRSGRRRSIPPQPKQAYPLDHTWVSRHGRRHPRGRRLRGLHEQHDAEHDRDRGGMWTARVLAGTRRYFGVEAAYVGNARGIDALGLQSNATLVVNGVEGDARVNVRRDAARPAAGAVRLRRPRVAALSGDEHQHVHVRSGARR